MKKRLFVVLIVGMFASSMGRVINHTAYAAPKDVSYHTLPFYQDWSDTGMITINDDWTGVPGVLGYRGDSLTATTDTNPQTLLMDDSPGVIDINANQTNPDTFTTGGVTEFDLTDDVVALTGSGTADAPYLQLHLNTTGWANIRVVYDLRDIDGSTDNAIQQVAMHYRLGSSGVFTNIPSAYVPDATTGPSLANLVTHVDVTLPSDANNQAELQIRIMTTNASGNDEWVGIDNISITGDRIPYHTITLDGNVNEWSSLEKLGSINGADFYLTWDDDYWYFGLKGGFGTSDYFLIGIDSDPTDESTNLGGTGERCGVVFPSENKPDYILANRQSSYTRESWGWDGANWNQSSWNPAETSEYDFSGGGGDYEVKLKKSSVFGVNEDTNPVAFYFWLSNGSCQTFNAWPPENENVWTGSAQFLFAHTRFQSTSSGIHPASDGQRIAWASNTLSSNSTVYNYFGGDDVSAGNPWLRLTTTAAGAGGASCTVRAKMVGTHAFTQSSFIGINRYVDFTLSNCTNLEVDVQMRYEDSELNGVNEAASQFFHCATLPCSSNWSAVAGGTYTRDTINNYLILTAVPQTQYSYWTISDTNAPTALTLTTLATRPLTYHTLFILTLTLLLFTSLLWARKRFVKDLNR
ncbi:MAG: hypothetical protein H6636_14340 [Anaerolineales bacterium]|nr:hypothetical protein [Anaerolineales bacterium]